jgi:hypothetical protein
VEAGGIVPLRWQHSTSLTTDHEERHRTIVLHPVTWEQMNSCTLVPPNKSRIDFVQ